MATQAPPPPPQWAINMNAAPQRPSKTSNIPDPPGFSKSTGKQVSLYNTPAASKPVYLLSLLLSLVTNLPTTTLRNIPKNRRNRYLEAEEIMGDRTGTR